MNGVAKAITAKRATHGVTMQKDCLAFQTIGRRVGFAATCVRQPLPKTCYERGQ
jgi:hypothetical protein